MPALPYLCRLVLFLGVHGHALFLSVSACLVGRGSFALFLSSASLTHRLADVKKLTALL
ncbi:hypothetical protein ASPFODRAFT_41476, partial [Aspergillus luchuensis CBS 106.47]